MSEDDTPFSLAEAEGGLSQAILAMKKARSFLRRGGSAQEVSDLVADIDAILAEIADE